MREMRFATGTQLVVGARISVGQVQGTSRAAQAAPGGCAYDVLTRALARLLLYRNEPDHAAFRPCFDSLSPKEAESVRLCIARNRPFGGEAWQQRMAARLGLMHTLRPEGRPRSRQAGVESSTT